MKKHPIPASVSHGAKQVAGSAGSYRKRLTLYLLIALAALVVGGAASAFFGNNVRIGNHRLPCAVACGGDRGAVNLRFPSDVVNTYLFSTTVDSLSSNMKAVGDQLIRDASAALGAVLEAKLETLNALATKQRTEFLSELDAVSGRALRDLDATLERRIAQVDQMADAQQGRFFGSLLRQVISLGQMALGIGGVFVLIAVFLKFRPGDHPAGAVVKLWFVIGVVGISVYLLPRAFVFSREADYKSEYAQFGFQNALVDATSLWKTWPKREKYRVWRDRTQLVRDFIEMPRVMTRDESLQDLSERIDNVETEVAKQFGVRDADLDVLRAIVFWRKSENRLGEYYSAMYAYNALKAAVDPQKDLPFALAEVGRYYVRAYLMRPLSDTQLKDLGFDRSDLQEKDSDGLVFPSIEQLRSVVSGAEPVGFAEAYQALHFETVPKYVKLVSLHAAMQSVPALNREAKRVEEIRLANEIIAAWEKFSEANLNGAAHRQRAGAVSGLFAIYARAEAYRRTLSAIDHSLTLDAIQIGTLSRTDLPVQPRAISRATDLGDEPCVGIPFHFGVLKNIPPRSNPIGGIYTFWFQNADSTVDRVLLADAKSTQQLAEDQLFSFEYFLYLSRIQPGTVFDGCFSPSKNEALRPVGAPVPAARVPNERAWRYNSPFAFKRKPDSERGPATDVQVFKELKMPPQDIVNALMNAVGEAATLGLFVCSDRMEEFDRCERYAPLVSVAQNLLETSPFRDVVPGGVQILADRSVMVRSFPILD